MKIVNTQIQYPECLNVNVGYANEVNSIEWTTKPLIWALTKATETTEETVRKIRLATSKDEVSILKRTLPCITPSATFNGPRLDEYQGNHTGLLAFDIDGKDNKVLEGRWNVLRDTLINLPYVAYSALSASGCGVWGLIPIANAYKHLEHFEAIQEDWKRRFRITIDRSCKDIGRVRYLAYDEEARVSQKVSKHPEPRPKPPQYKRKYPALNNTSSLGDDLSKVERLVSYCRTNCIDLTECNKDWDDIGRALCTIFGENGRTLYHSISEMYLGYTVEETNTQYTAKLRANKGLQTIGTLVYIARNAGIPDDVWLTESLSKGTCVSNDNLERQSPPLQNAKDETNKQSIDSLGFPKVEYFDPEGVSNLGFQPEVIDELAEININDYVNRIDKALSERDEAKAEAMKRHLTRRYGFSYEPLRKGYKRRYISVRNDKE